MQSLLRGSGWSLYPLHTSHCGSSSACPSHPWPRSQFSPCRACLPSHRTPTGTTEISLLEECLSRQLPGCHSVPSVVCWVDSTSPILQMRKLGLTGEKKKCLCETAKLKQVVFEPGLRPNSSGCFSFVCGVCMYV